MAAIGAAATRISAAARHRSLWLIRFRRGFGLDEGKGGGNNPYKADAGVISQIGVKQYACYFQLDLKDAMLQLIFTAWWSSYF